MKKSFFWIICLLTYSAAAQLQDDFNDQSFPLDPDWFGATSIYEVNASNELQLMDIDAGESFIYTAAATADSTLWEFFFRLEFNPSTDNFLRVYLKSDSPDLEGSLNGYYLQMGLAGSGDSIQLRRQDGMSTSLLLGGTVGAIAMEPAVRVRVIRNENADWQLFADYTGGTNFQLEGIVNDATYNDGAYFGFKSKYGVTRRDKFFFDDIIIGPLIQDNSAPELLSATALDGNNVRLLFTEPLDQGSAENSSNYTIDNGVTVNSATLDSDPSAVILSVSNLQSGTDYTAVASNIFDLSMNELIEGQTSFSYFLIEMADPFDILINEVFPNPDPEVTGLPDAEFIELFNRSDKAINIEGYKIFDANSEQTLPEYILTPASYLIICDDSNLDLFSSFGNVVTVSSLFALNDSGDDIGLKDEDEIEIHKISYTNNSYQDEDKASGGWTLELINPNLFCQGISNFRASNAAVGGTPGQENSVYENVFDTNAPQLLDVIATSENQLRLFFNESMSVNAEDVSSYSITDVGNVNNAELDEISNTVLLTFNAPFFEDQTMYTLTVNNTISDCSGNNIGATTFEFSFFQVQPVERYDILINEFYPDFTPSFGLPEKEFVELYNRSEKSINLEGFEIVNGTQTVALPFFLLQPNSYVILYEEGGQGFDPLGDTIVVPNFIGLANESDAFELYDAFGNLIHAVDYDKSWYQDSDKVDGGWSIELINPNAPCTFQSNWQASTDPSGGTPGRINSVFDAFIDETTLDLIRVFPTSTTSIQLLFNKALDISTSTNLDNYIIPGLTVQSANLVTPFNIVQLEFVEEMEIGVIYEVNVRSDLTDCIGNSVGVFDNARFALPQEIIANDIIINEVLYDPIVGGARFVELYNRSNKVFNLADLHIADRDDDGEDIDSNIEIDIDFLLFPGEYVVFTPSPQNISDLYFVEKPNQIIESSLPAYNSILDAVVIFVPGIFGPSVIDELEYTREFHNPLLDSRDGVSLERISFSGNTQDANNWQSAAGTVGFATPTYLNSQFVENNGVSETEFDIPNSTFSPDGDGFEDFLLLNYNATIEGWVANIQVFDANGRSVKKIAENITLAGNGTFKWEGETDGGEKARIGIYIIWIELFKANGVVERIKKTCVLAGRFD